MSRRLLTLDECAARTGTTIHWWRRRVFQREIPIVKLGRLVRVDEADLEHYLEVNREPARPALTGKGSSG